ncbi:hypothetical protein BaRGS_00033744 [Batillaria attramentaria]|uniref:Uncharacterized protein n=1 Tax=Batillaria attramentaria TaxID=370345 RepID=A0ABD0JJ15_9CAEN
MIVTLLLSTSETFSCQTRFCEICCFSSVVSVIITRENPKREFDTKVREDRRLVVVKGAANQGEIFLPQRRLLKTSDTARDPFRCELLRPSPRNGSVNDLSHVHRAEVSKLSRLSLD